MCSGGVSILPAAKVAGRTAAAFGGVPQSSLPSTTIMLGGPRSLRLLAFPVRRLTREVDDIIEDDYIDEYERSERLRSCEISSAAPFDDLA